MRNLLFGLLALTLVLPSCSKTAEIKPLEKPKHSSAKEANYVTLLSNNFQYTPSGSNMVTVVFYSVGGLGNPTPMGKEVEFSYTLIYKQSPIITLWSNPTVHNLDGFGSNYYQFTAPYSSVVLGVKVRCRTRTANDAEWSDYTYKNYYYYPPTDYSQFRVQGLYTSGGIDYINWQYDNPQNLDIHCYVTIYKKVGGNWVEVFDVHHVTGGTGYTSRTGTYEVGNPSWRDGSDIWIHGEWVAYGAYGVPGNGGSRTYDWYEYK